MKIQSRYHQKLYLTVLFRPGKKDAYSEIHKNYLVVCTDNSKFKIIKIF